MGESDLHLVCSWFARVASIIHRRTKLIIFQKKAGCLDVDKTAGENTKLPEGTNMNWRQIFLHFHFLHTQMGHVIAHHQLNLMILPNHIRLVNPSVKSRASQVSEDLSTGPFYKKASPGSCSCNSNSSFMMQCSPTSNISPNSKLSRTSYTYSGLSPGLSF